MGNSHGLMSHGEKTRDTWTFKILSERGVQEASALLPRFIHKPSFVMAPSRRYVALLRLLRSCQIAEYLKKMPWHWRR